MREKERERESEQREKGSAMVPAACAMSEALCRLPLYGQKQPGGHGFYRAHARKGRWDTLGETEAAESLEEREESV